MRELLIERESVAAQDIIKLKETLSCQEDFLHNTVREAASIKDEIAVLTDKISARKQARLDNLKKILIAIRKFKP